MLDPSTGEILAMAVVPRFNPNIFSRYPHGYWRNKVVTDCFEPGSTIKAFLLAGALEDGVLYPNSRLYCEMGKYKIADRIIHDTHKYGTLTVSDIVVLSSNIGAIKIGQQLGYDRFYNYLRGFGFGSQTGIDLLGERSGFVRSPRKANSVDQANTFFGQGLSVTALQLAVAMGCIANKGVLMKPYVVKKVMDARGHALKIIRPKIIITLGNVATSYILQKFGFKPQPISKIHGKVFKVSRLFQQLKIIAMYHPATALYNPRMKEVLREDWKRVKELLK